MPTIVKCWCHTKVLDQHLRDLDRSDLGTIDSLAESFLPDAPDPRIEEIDMLLDELEEFTRDFKF